MTYSTCHKLVDPWNVCVHVILTAANSRVATDRATEQRGNPSPCGVPAAKHGAAILNLSSVRPEQVPGASVGKTGPSECQRALHTLPERWGGRVLSEQNRRLNWIMLKDSVPCLQVVGRDFSVGTATRYGLDGPGIKSQWGWDFPHQSWLSPPIQWVPGSGVKHLTPI
jgi:hypothetical protein